MIYCSTLPRNQAHNQSSLPDCKHNYADQTNESQLFNSYRLIKNSSANIQTLSLRNPTNDVALQDNDFLHPSSLKIDSLSNELHSRSDHTWNVSMVLQSSIQRSSITPYAANS